MKSLALSIGDNQNQPLDFHDNKIIDSKNFRKTLDIVTICKAYKDLKSRLVFFLDNQKMFCLVIIKVAKYKLQFQSVKHSHQFSIR